MTTKVPTQARAWQYRKVTGGLENNLELNIVDVPKPKPNQHLVRVIAASLNPLDYKIAEAPFVGSFAVSKPATPGFDVAGEIVIAAKDSDLKVGTLVFGAGDGNIAAAATHAEYVLLARDQTAVVPSNVSVADAASLPCTAVTAMQALKPYVKQGDHVFFNGGSGGVGVLALQVAKVLGAHVTVTCSSRNVDFVKSLGADEVVDYTKGDVLAQLSGLPYKFDHVVDGIGNDRALYWKAHEYTNPGAKVISIAFSPSPADISFIAKALLWPGFLGGGRRPFVNLMAVLKQDDLQQVITWVSEGRIKAVIDSRYSLEQLPDAFRKLKTSRARGKIILDVAKA